MARPAIVIPSDVERVHLASAKAMLAVEGLAVKAFKEVVRGTRLPSDPVDAARVLGDALAPVLLSARKAARQVAAKRFAVEIDQARHDMFKAGFKKMWPLPVVKPPTDLDRLSAERAARGYADAVLKEALRRQAVDDGPVNMIEVVADTESRLDGSATSEVGEASADQKARIGRQVAKEQEGQRWLPALLKVWDARMDACPKCYGMNRKVRPVGMTFSGKEPGSVHRACRCFAAIMFVPAYLGRRDSDDEDDDFEADAA